MAAKTPASRRSPPDRGNSLRIAVFVVLAAVWILALDIYLLSELSAGRDLLVVFAIKGAIFIAVAARWLYGLLRQQDRARATADAAGHSRMQRVAETTADGILTVDQDGNITYANPAAAQILGFSRQRLTELRFDDPAFKLLTDTGQPLEPEQHPVASVLRTGSPVIGQMQSVERPDGAWIVLCMNAAPLGQQEPGGAVVSFTDLTEQLASDEQMHQLAYYDRITSLPNRVLMEKYIDFAISSAKQHSKAVCLLHVDIDGFKMVNDSLGKRGGDRLLGLIARRLQSVLEGADVVGRLHGDDFQILLADRAQGEVGSAGSDDVPEPPQSPVAVARRLLLAMRSPFKLEGQEIFVGASVGISSYPFDAGSPDKLIKHAEEAMYQAKKGGKGTFSLYEDELSGVLKTRFVMVTMLHQAIERQEFVIHYQPVIDLQSGKMVGTEALVRWQTRDGRTVQPAEFIPLAEETGLIVGIGRLVIDEVCRQLHEWQELGFELYVAMNLSVQQFLQEDLVADILAALERQGVPSAMLEVEITESVVERGPDRAARVVQELRDAGVNVAIDDFGTGFSSLSRLKRLAANRLKIDQSFISGIPGEREDLAIVNAIITLDKALGKETLAEGIESAQQWLALRREGCPLGQGYYFSQPVPAAEIEAMIARGDCWELPPG